MLFNVSNFLIFSGSFAGSRSLMSASGATVVLRIAQWPSHSNWEGPQHLLAINSFRTLWRSLWKSAKERQLKEFVPVSKPSQSPRLTQNSFLSWSRSSMTWVSSHSSLMIFFAIIFRSAPSGSWIPKSNRVSPRPPKAPAASAPFVSNIDQCWPWRHVDTWCANNARELSNFVSAPCVARMSLERHGPCSYDILWWVLRQRPWQRAVWHLMKFDDPSHTMAMATMGVLMR